MQAARFERLCREASEQLGLKETTALALGVGVSFDDVLFEAAFVDGQNSFLLLADLGAFGRGDQPRVYESLFALQLAAWDEPRLRFGFHPIREVAVLTVGVPLGEKTDAQRLVMLVKSIASRVTQWRQT